MSKVFLVLTVVTVIVWLYFLWSRRRFYKIYWQMRGPLGLPFIGLGLQLMKPEKFLQYMQEKGQEYETPFISWMGTKCFLYVNDPETIETIFNSSYCTNKGEFYRFMAAAIGDGLFTSSSPRWNKHRRLINPAFSRQVINTFLPIFNKEANTLINKLTRAQGQPLEIYEILKRSVLESACQTTMGKKMNFQNKDSAAIFDAYNGITEVCVRRMLSPWLYPNIIYRFSSLFKHQQAYTSILYKFVENLIHQHDNMKNSATLASAGKTIITNNAIKEIIANKKTVQLHNENNLNIGSHDDHNVYDNDGDVNNDNNTMIKKSKSYVFIEQVHNYIAEGHLTWQDVRDEANVIVAATFETTSTALYLVCLCLAMHPEYQDKLYKELVEIFPNCEKLSYNRSSVNNDLVLTDATLKHLERMTYTEMVINEAMRLFAPVPMVLRQVSSDFQLGNGAILPKGTQIAIDIYNMQRNKNVWGPLAHTFNPEKHFATSNKPHPFAFVPFTKGLRMCIGYRYALILMKVMLAKIFRNFRIYTDAKLHDLNIKSTISLKLCEYPLCELQLRKSCKQNEMI